MILVDSNVVIDWLTRNTKWYGWSLAALEEAFETTLVGINPIIYAEVSCAFERIEDLDEALPQEMFKRLVLPCAAGFLAAKCFLKYRKRGGARSSPLPDFYIGAHAAIEQMTLLTRDASRYRDYFPTLRLIAP